MRFRRWIVPLVMAVVLVALAPPARGQAETMVVALKDEPLLAPGVVFPCTGAVGDALATLNGVTVLTTSAAGTVNMQFTGTGTFTFVPTDGSGVTYSGRVTAWFGSNMNLVNGQFTSTFHITAKGSDGSVVRSQGTGHITIVGDDVVVEFVLEVCA